MPLLPVRGRRILVRKPQWHPCSRSGIVRDTSLDGRCGHVLGQLPTCLVDDPTLLPAVVMRYAIAALATFAFFFTSNTSEAHACGKWDCANAGPQVGFTTGSVTA